jgi:hypothetical protein
MSFCLRLLLVLGLSLAIAGCGGGGNGDVPPGGSTNLNFAAFISAMISATAENTDPAELNNLGFTFSEDPAAFGDLC